MQKTLFIIVTLSLIGIAREVLRKRFGEKALMKTFMIVLPTLIVITPPVYVAWVTLAGGVEGSELLTWKQKMGAASISWFALGSPFLLFVWRCNSRQFAISRRYKQIVTGIFVPLLIAGLVMGFAPLADIDIDPSAFSF